MKSGFAPNLSFSMSLFILSVWMCYAIHKKAVYAVLIAEAPSQKVRRNIFRFFFLNFCNFRHIAVSELLHAVSGINTNASNCS